MRSTFVMLAIGAVTALGIPGARAADNEAGVPLQPTEAAGAWTLESHGQDLCTLTLGTRRQSASGYQVERTAACDAVLPQAVTAWMPTHDGMAFLGPTGATLIAFNRWSNSLFVSHTSSGVDVQLRRGHAGPVAPGG